MHFQPIDLQNNSHNYTNAIQMFIEKNNRLIIFFFCLINLLLHLIADYHSGFQGDELLHIATGNHPAFGYMEFPPLIGWLAYLQNQFGSTSVFVHHLFTHLASVLFFIFAGLSVLELGGRSRALILTLLCLLVAPGIAKSQQLFQPVIFSQLFWMLSFYALIRFVKLPSNRSLAYLTGALVLGFLSKYDMFFFMGGMTCLFFFKHTNAVLLSKNIWKYVFIFLLLISPNLWWQYSHHFPVFQMFSRLYETQLDKLTIFTVLKGIIIELNPVTCLIWLPGFILLFYHIYHKPYRPVALTVLLAVMLLAVSKSKDYYFFPVISFMLIIGGIWIEQHLLSKKWQLYPILILLVLSGVIILPFGLALMPMKQMVATYKLKKEHGVYKMDFEEYDSKEKWKNTLTAIKSVYDSLPASERKDCLIWGKHYKQAGAVDLLGDKFGLPKSFSYHGSFYLWAPKGPMPEVVIGFTNGEARIEFFENYFKNVVAVKMVRNPYASFEKDIYQTIYVCKEPRQSFDQMSVLFSKRVFE